jgi:hypothetical protein
MGQEVLMRAVDTPHRNRAATTEHPDWTELLVKAVTKPGVISDA